MTKRVLPLTRESGPPTYWRGLDHLAEHPQVKSLLEREFPEGAHTLDAPTRRTFLSLMGASFAMMGITGCVRRPEEKIIPYTKAPEGVIPGVAQFYATSLQRDGESCSVIVESHEGRPTKIEGNPEHPTMLGGTLPWLQASVLELYDPDRAQSPTKDGVPVSTEVVLEALDGALERGKASGGEKLRVLMGSDSSPTLQRLKTVVLARFPKAKFCEYDAVGANQAALGAKLAFGADVRPLIAYEKAAVILSVDCDFLATEPGAVRANKLFARGRKVRRVQDAMNRLYVAEPAFTSTGMSADHRLRLPASAMVDLLVSLGAALVKRGVSFGGLDAKLQPSATVDARWVNGVADDLLRNRGASVVVVGCRQPAALHALAHAINHALGNFGKTVRLVAGNHSVASADAASLRTGTAAPLEMQAEKKPSTEAPLDLMRLVAEMQQGKVDTLIVLGGNPVYGAPGDVDVASALLKVATRLHVSSHRDETSLLCNYTLPRAHDLEAWRDAVALDGTTNLSQPLIAPLFNGKADTEVIAHVAGQRNARSYDLVRETFQHAYTASHGVLETLSFERSWKRAIHDGFVASSAPSPVELTPSGDAIAKALPKPVGSLPTAQALEVTFAPDAAVYDGRYANVAWMQELPHPVTKMTWDNAAWLSVKTAGELGVESGDVIRLTSQGRSIEIPVWIVPGTADGSVQLHLGWGRTQAGRVGTSRGVNVAPLREFVREIVTGVRAEKTSNVFSLAVTQEHNVLEGRPIVREATLAEYRKDPGFADKMVEHPPLLPLWKERTYEGHKWGMVIDLSSCTGCNTCVIACQAENNIPTVGKEQVTRQREMHWLRLDRYFSGSVENPAVVQQPMACVHCENAPCENVCPVNATSHSPEGLNEMTYNRCIGTRYCSNNCPYKVRRFNFLDYHEDVPETVKMVANPNVSVRMRGVMEKCTYCVQRIQKAKLNAKKENRPLRDGDVVSACAQACPADAIVFGDLNDKGSRVAKAMEAQQGYRVLDELNTKPRTTYLAKIRNPNPELA